MNMQIKDRVILLNNKDNKIKKDEGLIVKVFYYKPGDLKVVDISWRT